MARLRRFRSRSIEQHFCSADRSKRKRTTAIRSQKLGYQTTNGASWLLRRGRHLMDVVVVVVKKEPTNN
jgi:hypothetical protein